VETIAGPDGKLMLVRTNSVSGTTSIFHSPTPANPESANLDARHPEAGQ
jgi:hypothetical protein